MAFRMDHPYIAVPKGMQVKYPAYHLALMNPGFRTAFLRDDMQLEGFFGDVGDFFQKTFEKIPQMAVGAGTGYLTSGGDWMGAAAGAIAARTRKGKWLKFKVFPSAVIPGAIAGAAVGVGKMAYAGFSGAGIGASPLGSVLGKTGNMLKGAWGTASNAVIGGSPTVVQTAGGGFVNLPAGGAGWLAGAGDKIVAGAKAVGNFAMQNPTAVMGVAGSLFAGAGGGEPEQEPEPMPEESNAQIVCNIPPCPGDPGFATAHPGSMYVIPPGMQVVPGPVYGPYLPPPDGAYVPPEYAGQDPYYVPQGAQYMDYETGSATPIGPSFETGSQVVTQTDPHGMNRAGQMYSSPSLYNVSPTALQTEIMETNTSPQNYYVDYLDGVPGRWPLRRRGQGRRRYVPN